MQTLRIRREAQGFRFRAPEDEIRIVIEKRADVGAGFQYIVEGPRHDPFAETGKREREFIEHGRVPFDAGRSAVCLFGADLRAVEHSEFAFHTVASSRAGCAPLSPNVLALAVATLR